jgi:hypothetical protein
MKDNRIELKKVLGYILIVLFIPTLLGCVGLISGFGFMCGIIIGFIADLFIAGLIGFINLIIYLIWESE